MCLLNYCPLPFILQFAFSFDNTLHYALSEDIDCNYCGWQPHFIHWWNNFLLVAHCDDLSSHQKRWPPSQNQRPFCILAAANSMLIKVYHHTADTILFLKHIEFLYHSRQYLQMGFHITLMLIEYNNVLTENLNE